MNSNNSSADEFRPVDLFSPSETNFAPPSADDASADSAAPRSPRMSGELPDSFLFANPFFAPSRKSPRDQKS